MRCRYREVVLLGISVVLRCICRRRLCREHASKEKYSQQGNANKKKSTQQGNVSKLVLTAPALIYLTELVLIVLI